MSQTNEPQHTNGKKKILLYNWVRFDHPWGWGGGVTVYCRNIVEGMLRSVPSAEVYFLSSGTAYAADSTDPYYRKIDNVFGDRMKQYEIVNSPVPADQRNLYINPVLALENKKLRDTVASFIKKHGPFEAIHFNNLEGLSLDVFDLKKQFPETKFIFSIHNYIPVCVTGSYYMRHKHCLCSPGHTAEDCFKCTRADIRSDIGGEIYRRALVAGSLLKNKRRNKWISGIGFETLDKDIDPGSMLLFAKTATEKINRNCDTIIAVSKRVYEIARDNGIDESKMIVQYIGTKVADKQKPFHKPPEKGKGIKIVFLGSNYDYEEKGYKFLLSALSGMPEEYASQIDLFMTVGQPKEQVIKEKCRKFRSVTVKLGYSHDDFDMIFKDADLSIVPVLWEDNLPQIAIESAAYGVPVLSSTAGGAKELSDSELFRFRCADAEDLRRKIEFFVDNPDKLADYNAKYHGLTTMKKHISELMNVYGIGYSEGEKITLEPVKRKPKLIRGIYRFRYCAKKASVIILYKTGVYGKNRIKNEAPSSDQTGK